MIDIKKIENDHPEQALLIYASRLTLGENEKQAISRILSTMEVNWFEFMKLALYHKTIFLCWKNINAIYPKHNIPKFLLDSIGYMYEGTKIRNQCNIKEKDTLLKKCLEAKITCIPVKGAYLIENMYKDCGLRYSGDMDFLIKYDDVTVLKEILVDMGYVNGKYTNVTQQINPLTREKEIMWKMYMSNLPPYVKLSNNVFFPYYKFDFRFALDDSLNKEPIREIVENTQEVGNTSPSHYLVHMCTHFYDEAKHAVTIAKYKDINIIKLCDIREFILKFMTVDDLQDTVSFCSKYNLKPALCYTMFFLEQIYNDGYEKRIIESLQIDNKTFLHTYGDSTLSNQFLFQKTIEERLFSCGNIDELLECPKFQQLK